MSYSITRFYNDHYSTDCPDDEGHEIECPVISIEAEEGNRFKDKETGRFITAKDALDLMHEEGYSGPEVGDAQWVVNNQEYLRTGNINAYSRGM